MDGISGGLGNLPWGCRHWGWVWGHLKGPFWHLFVRGWSSRVGGWGSKNSALPLLSDRGGVVGVGDCIREF